MSENAAGARDPGPGPYENVRGLRLDHLVIAAADLRAGVAWVEAAVGVPLEPGGRHELFGTHNALLSLGSDAYLEVIAVDPDAPVPSRPRWFALDTPAMRERLADGPALVHWVAAADALDGHPDAIEVTRGDNRWTLTVPADGSLPHGGIAPSLIAWHTTAPAARLPDRGVRLTEFAVATDDEDLRRRLAGMAVPQLRVRRGGPALAAVVATPSGPVRF